MQKYNVFLNDNIKEVFTASIGRTNASVLTDRLKNKKSGIGKEMNLKYRDFIARHSTTKEHLCGVVLYDNLKKGKKMILLDLLNMYFIKIAIEMVLENIKREGIVYYRGYDITENDVKKATIKIDKLFNYIYDLEVKE